MPTLDPEQEALVAGMLFAGARVYVGADYPGGSRPPRYVPSVTIDVREQHPLLTQVFGAPRVRTHFGNQAMWRYGIYSAKGVEDLVALTESWLPHDGELFTRLSLLHGLMTNKALNATEREAVVKQLRKRKAA